MSAVLQILIVVATYAAFSQAFKVKNHVRTFHTHSRLSAVATWQQELDDALDIDTSCETRQTKLQDLIQNRASEIGKDLQESLSSRDTNVARGILAPPTTKYGKALDGLQEFRKQLRNDIIPALLTKQLPILLKDGPKLLSEALAEAPKAAKGLVEQIREISGDASALQSTTEELRREVKNIFKATPEGLETPSYVVLNKANAAPSKGYEVRAYSGYSVCSTAGPTTDAGSSSGSKEKDVLSSGRSFNALAGYLFGDNKSEEKMSMTTPVIMAEGQMSFVLPKGKSSANAPVPKSDSIVITDVAEALAAVREFTGICTESEVAKQRALLEDALLFDGIAYDNLSFQVLQYNPPYTLPWVRRNEVVLKVLSSRDMFVEAALEAEVVPMVEVVHEQAPEAGD